MDVALAGRVSALKAQARTATRIPWRFSELAPNKTPNQKLQELYASRKLRNLITTSKPLTMAVFTQTPLPNTATASKLLENSLSEAPLIALRSYLADHNLEGAFTALDSVPTKPDHMPLIGFFGTSILSFVSLLTWGGPIGCALSVFWTGLGVCALVPPKYSWARWSTTTPRAQRAHEKLLLANHIVAWYQDEIGVTVHNFHRRHSEGVQDQSEVLNRLLNERGLVRVVHDQEIAYAQYWTFKGRFVWTEPEHDPAHFKKR